MSLLVVWDAKCKMPISWRMKSLFRPFLSLNHVLSAIIAVGIY